MKTVRTPGGIHLDLTRSEAEPESTFTLVAQADHGPYAVQLGTTGQAWGSSRARRRRNDLPVSREFTALLVLHCYDDPARRMSVTLFTTYRAFDPILEPTRLLEVGTRIAPDLHALFTPGLHTQRWRHAGVAAHGPCWYPPDADDAWATVDLFHRTAHDLCGLRADPITPISRRTDARTRLLWAAAGFTAREQADWSTVSSPLAAWSYKQHDFNAREATAWAVDVERSRRNMPNTPPADIAARFRSQGWTAAQYRALASRDVRVSHRQLGRWAQLEIPGRLAAQAALAGLSLDEVAAAGRTGLNLEALSSLAALRTGTPAASTVSDP